MNDEIIVLSEVAHFATAVFGAGGVGGLPRRLGCLPDGLDFVYMITVLSEEVLLVTAALVAAVSVACLVGFVIFVLV